MLMTAKSNRRKSVGSIFIGFAILMFGMETMSGAMSPLADMPSFRNTMIAFTNPILGFLVGMVITMIIQSSSASIGILQALTLVAGVSWEVAIPIFWVKISEHVFLPFLQALGLILMPKELPVFM